MLKHLITCLSFFWFFFGTAQNTKLDTINTTQEIQKDSTNVFYNPKTYGLRIGLDIVKPVLSFYSEDFAGAEIVADWRINTRLFVAGEFGYNERSIEEDYFTHTANGTYLKLGVNYNLYTNWLDMDNETYLGARYGVSLFNNKLDSYTIAQNGEYFNPKTIPGQEYTNLNTHWFEFVAGLKVEVFNNLFLGFMISISKVIYNNDPENFQNTYSPGIGEINSNGVGANINYSISYRIPLYKK